MVMILIMKGFCLMKRLMLIFIIGFMTFFIIACDLEQRPNDDETPTQLTTPLTDALTLDLDYEGKTFTEDGIGEVTLQRCIDGDTTRFYEDGVALEQSVRYLGIDTPETWRNPSEPWADAASDYVCDVLQNAETIVLERNFDGPLYETYGRYLAFVWADGRLLNLELIELAYAHAVGASNLKYGDEMMQAWFNAMETGRRIHGERDPDYPYDD